MCELCKAFLQLYNAFNYKRIQLYISFTISCKYLKAYRKVKIRWYGLYANADGTGHC